MNIKDIKNRIKNDTFDCVGITCTICPFTTDIDLDCGGHPSCFDFDAIKASKVSTLKGLLRFKSKTNNYKYPKLK